MHLLVLEGIYILIQLIKIYYNKYFVAMVPQMLDLQFSKLAMHLLVSVYFFPSSVSQNERERKRDREAEKEREGITK